MASAILDAKQFGMQEISERGVALFLQFLLGFACGNPKSLKRRPDSTSSRMSSCHRTASSRSGARPRRRVSGVRTQETAAVIEIIA
jgi:hypothetical protein